MHSVLNRSDLEVNRSADRSGLSFHPILVLVPGSLHPWQRDEGPGGPQFGHFLRVCSQKTVAHSHWAPSCLCGGDDSANGRPSHRPAIGWPPSTARPTPEHATIPFHSNMHLPSDLQGASLRHRNMQKSDCRVEMCSGQSFIENPQRAERAVPKSAKHRLPRRPRVHRANRHSLLKPGPFPTVQCLMWTPGKAIPLIASFGHPPCDCHAWTSSTPLVYTCC